MNVPNNKLICDKIFVSQQLQDLCIAFADLTKALDTVNRDLLWNIQHKFGCPPTFIAILQHIHTGMCAQVVMAGSQSSSFPVEVGVKQGCVITPIIFNLLLVAIHFVSHHASSPNAPTFSISRKQHKSEKMSLEFGSNLSLSSDLINEIQRCINLASSAFRRLRERVFGNRNITLHRKIAVYNAVVTSTILYGCESIPSSYQATEVLSQQTSQVNS